MPELCCRKQGTNISGSSTPIPLALVTVIMLFISCTLSFASEWQTSMLAIYREHGDTWNPSPGNKLHEKEVQLCKRMEESKAEYENTVDHVNTLQNDIFASQLPEVCLLLFSFSFFVVNYLSMYVLLLFVSLGTRLTT